MIDNDIREETLSEKRKGGSRFKLKNITRKSVHVYGNVVCNNEVCETV